jgi:hypothetical protein
MGHINAITVVNRFKRTFGEETLNELGKISRFCRRERTVTPHRLALSLIEMFAGGRVKYIADLQRGFHALCASGVQYKPFHNQLAKRHFLALLHNPGKLNYAVVRALDYLSKNARRSVRAAELGREMAGDDFPMYDWEVENHDKAVS